MNGDAILPSEGKEASVSENILRGYVGRYRSSNPEHPLFVLLTFADGHLYVQNEGAKTSPSRMMAETPSKFYLANQEAELTFDPGSGGLEIVDFSSIWGDAYTRVPESQAQTTKQGPN
jgi:hypothetical protein